MRPCQLRHGFEALAQDNHKPARSLHRMLSPSGAAQDNHTAMAHGHRLTLDGIG